MTIVMHSSTAEVSTLRSFSGVWHGGVHKVGGTKFTTGLILKFYLFDLIFSTLTYFLYMTKVFYINVYSALDFVT